MSMLLHRSDTRVADPEDGVKTLPLLLGARDTARNSAQSVRGKLNIRSPSGAS